MWFNRASANGDKTASETEIKLLEIGRGPENYPGPCFLDYKFNLTLKQAQYVLFRGVGLGQHRCGCLL
jgi:hypothetical protein